MGNTTKKEVIAMGFDQLEMGKRIRAERKKNRLTIERLCELLEVSPSFIGLVERGDSGISLEKLCRLSEILNVSTDYLLMGDKTTPPPQEKNLGVLNAALLHYSEEELQFVMELLDFLRIRTALFGKKKEDI